MQNRVHIGQGRRQAPRGTHPLQVLLVLLRVAAVLVVWLSVFLMTFVGVLTLPAILLCVFLSFYTILEIVSRRIRRADEAEA